MSDFERALAFVFDVEGNFSDRPPEDDPGGPTLWGLSRRFNPDMPWPPTRAEAVNRYRRHYWDPVQGDRVPWPVSLILFDAAVQHAPDDAIKFLQVALGVTVDGVLGPRTLAAVRAHDALAIAEEMLARRHVYYPSLDNWEANSLGWMRRLVRLHREAMMGEV